jgi:hypothetical protein
MQNFIEFDVLFWTWCAVSMWIRVPRDGKAAFEVKKSLVSGKEDLLLNISN